jgi:hypothetical protein
MHIGGLLVLITTSRDTQFTTVEKIESRTSSLLAKGIMVVVNLYKKRGFIIDIFLMDNKFENVRGILQEQKNQSNICAPNEHVPEVELKIRTVKERVRGIIKSLPFQTIPTIIIIHAFIFLVMWLNFIPPKGGVPLTLSPQAIITELTKMQLSSAGCHSGHTLRYMANQNMEMMQLCLEQLGANR